MSGALSDTVNLGVVCDESSTSMSGLTPAVLACVERAVDQLLDHVAPLGLIAAGLADQRRPLQEVGARLVVIVSGRSC